jgi:8-oxo-dGTP pyrophosphatase MutT (NUDIX family)
VGRPDGALARLNVAGWHALGEATRAERPRVPFVVGGRVVGSVARAHLPALRRFDDLLSIGETVELRARDRDAAFASLNTALHEAGLIVAWRHETYPVPDPDSLETLATIERASSRFWGTLTFGAHATGYVADAAGRPREIWIAQRALTKATDPGRFDNLIGGGVPHGQTPAQALVREGFEEAGLSPAQLAHARAGSVLRLARDIPEGFQHEWLHSFDVVLPEGTVPQNQDGEVAGFQRLSVADALALATGARMTVDAALVTLDFAVRHGLLDDPALVRGVQALRVAHA